MLKIVATSDTHNKYNKLIIPPCDILIDCGDYSFKGSDSEIRSFYKWLNKQKAAYKISIQGNHELGWEANPIKGRKIALEQCPAVHLLNNETIEIEGIKIFGSAYSPYFNNWAYNGARTLAESYMYNKPLLKDIWKEIQPGTNIIATHTPAYEILDELCYIDGTGRGQFVGCVDLRDRLLEIKPDIHLCGHLHEQGGKERHINGISYYNVANCDKTYNISNEIRIIDYEK